MTDWIPLNDNVLLRPLEKLPELWKAEVIAVGAGFPSYSGVRIPLDVKPGDVVLIPSTLIVDVFRDGERLFLEHASRIRIKLGEKQCEDASGA